MFNWNFYLSVCCKVDNALLFVDVVSHNKALNGFCLPPHANVRQACAPLFHWNVLVDQEEAMDTPVGNCQLLNMQTGELANYAPCREEYVESIYTRGCKTLNLPLSHSHVPAINV